MISLAFTCFSDDIRDFPICLELPGSSFGGVFKNFLDDKHSDLKDLGPCLAVVVSSCSLLVVDHPDGRIFSYFIRPV